MLRALVQQVAYVLVTLPEEMGNVVLIQMPELIRYQALLYWELISVHAVLDSHVLLVKLVSVHFQRAL